MKLIKFKKGCVELRTKKSFSKITYKQFYTRLFLLIAAIVVIVTIALFVFAPDKCNCHPINN